MPNKSEIQTVRSHIVHADWYLMIRMKHTSIHQHIENAEKLCNTALNSLYASAAWNNVGSWNPEADSVQVSDLLVELHIQLRTAQSQLSNALSSRNTKLVLMARKSIHAAIDNLDILYQHSY